MELSVLRLRLIQAFAAVLLVSTLSTGARAQMADQGRGLIEAAVRAIEGVETMTARITLEGGGSKNFMQFMPSGEGVFRAQRAEDDEGQRVWATRLVGAGKDRGDGEEYTFDAATRGDTITWVEHRSKSVNTNTRARARGVGLSMRQQMNIDELLADEPMARELDALEYEVKGRETIGGVECDVVLVTHPKPEPGAARGGKALPNKTTWYLGVEDQLPRRVERTTDADIIAISLIVTLENLTINADITPEDLEVAVPEGYRKVEPRPASGPVTRNARPTGVQRGENAPTARPAPSRAKAPTFSVKDGDGAEVSTQTQSGRISVIYFWGTWCVPCRNYSPLVSGLAEKFAGEPVDVLAPAIRSNPERAGGAIREKGYRQRLLVGADEMARDFRVRVYPTIYVLDAEGGVIATESPTRGDSPEEMVQRVEQLVRDELARMDDG